MPFNVSISYRRFIRSISDTQDILPKETVIEQGGMDNTISEIVKRVQNTVTASNVIKSSVEVEPGGATGSISDYAKRVDLTIDSDFKIKNGVKVVAGGADGTLSKRTKSLGDAGMLQEMQANETVTIAATTRIDDVTIGDAVLLSVEVDSGVVGKVSISGISNVITNRILYIFAKDRDLPLLHENTNSVASNRFDLPGGANVEIPAGAFACCMYINFRWRVQQIT